jgi:tetrahydromethanopterin S-methyltransferase subunit H
MVAEGVVVVIVTDCVDVYVPPVGLNVGLAVVATVTVAAPWIVPVAAVILAVPVARAVVRPVVFGEATDVLLEAHFTWVVRSEVLESL